MQHSQTYRISAKNIDFKLSDTTTPVDLMLIYYRADDHQKKLEFGLYKLCIAFIFDECLF